MLGVCFPLLPNTHCEREVIDTLGLGVSAVWDTVPLNEVHNTNTRTIRSELIVSTIWLLECECELHCLGGLFDTYCVIHTVTLPY